VRDLTSAYSILSIIILTMSFLDVIVQVIKIGLFAKVVSYYIVQNSLKFAIFPKCIIRIIRTEQLWFT